MPDRNDNFSNDLGSTPPASSGTQRTGSSSATSRVAEGGRKVMEKAGNQARQQFDTQKERAVEGASTIAGALRRTADNLRDENQLSVARYIEMAAERVEDITDNIAGKDLDRIVYDVQSFARRRPAVFFGSALALGFLASRFIKASNERYRDDDLDFVSYGESANRYSTERAGSFGTSELATGSPSVAGTTFATETDEASGLQSGGLSSGVTSTSGSSGTRTTTGGLSGGGSIGTGSTGSTGDRNRGGSR